MQIQGKEAIGKEAIVNINTGSQEIGARRQENTMKGKVIQI